MAKILIVEDEKAINDLIKLNLELVKRVKAVLRRTKSEPHVFEFDDI